MAKSNQICLRDQADVAGAEAGMPIRARLTRRDRARSVLRLLAALLCSCAPVVTSTTPRDVRTVVVLPVDNRTGSALYADAPPLVGLLREEPPPSRLTAPDILTAELRRELAARGFTVLVREENVRSAAEAAQVVAAAGIDAPALLVRLWTWDASAPSHVLFVDVRLDATLVAPDGRVLWQATFPSRPVDGGGASSVTLAYPAVARRVVGATLGDLAPAASP